jgi:hypothetical protein
MIYYPDEFFKLILKRIGIAFHRNDIDARVLLALSLRTYVTSFVQAGPADEIGMTRVFSSRAATSLRHAFLCTDHAAVWHATPQ